MNKKVYKITIRKSKTVYKPTLGKGLYQTQFIAVLKERCWFLFPYWWGINYAEGGQSLIDVMVNRWNDKYNVIVVEDYTE